MVIAIDLWKWIEFIAIAIQIHCLHFKNCQDCHPDRGLSGYPHNFATCQKGIDSFSPETKKGVLSLGTLEITLGGATTSYKYGGMPAKQNLWYPFRNFETPKVIPFPEIFVKPNHCRVKLHRNHTLSGKNCPACYPILGL